MLVVVVVFTSLEVITFPGYFSLPSSLHPSFSGPWRPPPALSSTLATFSCFTSARLFRHSFTASAKDFEWAFFTRRRFLPYAPSPTILSHFPTQVRAGTPHPGSSSVPALTGLSLPADAWTWTTHIVVTRPLIYELRQWATKCKVTTELLNMFCLFKVIWKDHKNILNKTW